MEKFVINAMMEDDMFAFMKKNGYWDSMKEGLIRCPCGEIITEENLTAMKKVKGIIYFYHNIICTEEN